VLEDVFYRICLKQPYNEYHCTETANGNSKSQMSKQFKSNNSNSKQASKGKDEYSRDDIYGENEGDEESNLAMLKPAAKSNQAYGVNDANSNHIQQPHVKYKHTKTKHEKNKKEKRRFCVLPSLSFSRLLGCLFKDIIKCKRNKKSVSAQ
jgi:hypothetical protein